ncbi:MAG: glycosyl hydrolase [Verrucomicrobiales bacterium]|nr:glycosyl hydrolase [Verrucomicrobiales bacterium]|tara:strand:- start:697 stop:1620 length:924 start_codon:yes stop_codon:yes gene_type:complete
MNTRSFTAIIPVAILAIVIGASNAQKNKKQVHAEKIAAGVPKSAPAKPTKPRKVLVFSKTAGFRHGSIPTGVEAMKQMGKSTGAFEVTATEDDSFFEPEKLKDFDAVLFLNTTGEVFKSKEAGREERLKKSLVDFVKSGKGLIGTHSATDTYKKWKDFNDMMGGAFAGHPWHTKIRVKNLEPGHPLNAAFAGKDFEIADEIYQFRKDTASADERRMLLSLSGEIVDKGKGNTGKEGLYPIAWLDKYGDGRIFYCSLGHRDEIYWNPVILKHYLAGIQYALGDLDAEDEPRKITSNGFMKGTKNLVSR